MKPDLKSLFPHASESTIRRNPHLYSVCPFPSEVAQPDPAQALDRGGKKREAIKDGVEYRVAIIALRKRLADADNNVASFKNVQDSIAATLGIDDGDPRIQWEYGQIQTNGEQGLLVKIEMR